MKIVQLLPSIRTGDAVSNDALLLQKLLRSLDKDTKIYARNIGAGLDAELVRPASKFPKLTDRDLLIYHMSVGDEVSRIVEEQSCRKLMIFHNITPPEYFEGYSREYVNACAGGYAELERLRYTFDYAICVSEFDRITLEAAGYTCPMAVCPVLVPMEDYGGEPDEYTMQKYADGRTNILFVGRLAPNKRQEDVIAAFAAYREKYDPAARLILVGADGITPYTRRLRNYIRTLAVPNVKLTGSVSLSVLLALYRRSSALLCMSEHEGFCVPLLEAMHFDLPIVARDSSAIGETLGGSGVLLPDNDPEAAADALHRLLTDTAYRESVLTAQRARLAELTDRRVGERRIELIRELMTLPLRPRPKRFVQALPRLSRGDAIGDEALTLWALSKEVTDCRSDIWTEFCEDEVLRASALCSDTAPALGSEDICLYHFASGDRMADQFLRLKCRKVLLYHGMTPAEFFTPYSSGYAEAAEKGRKQLEKLIAATEVQWADSDYDRAELEALGAKNVRLLPLLLHEENYRLKAVNSSIFDDGSCNILFVGRLAPNKRVEKLIDAFALYQRSYDADARLLLCGDEWAVESYSRRLRAYVRRLGLENVYFLGKVSRNELSELYDCASVLVTLSEHEGYCVPLAEAMLTDTPVLALNAAAMGETMGEGNPGLLPDSEPETVAEALHRLMSEESYRRELSEFQRERAKALSPETVGRRATELLQSLWEK